MFGSTTRRKHSACLLRIRESCPFRKLRKIKCSGSSSCSEAVGRRWGNCHANCAKAYAQGLGAPYHQLQEQQGAYSAMDAEAAAPCEAEASFSNLSAGASCTGPVSSPSNLLRLHQSILSTSDPSMELDSGIDPETGERAQG